MAEGRDTAEHSEWSSRLRNIPAVVAAVLGTLALVTYPLGFVAYWIQIWREYTHDATTALNAAALIPVPVVAIGALGVLSVALVAAVVATTVSSGWAQYKLRQVFLHYEVLREMNLGRFHRFSMSRLGGIVLLIGYIIAGALVPYALGLVILDSGSDVIFYAIAVTIAGASGFFAAWLEFREAPEELPESGSFVQGVIAIITGTILAALFLIPLRLHHGARRPGRGDGSEDLG